MNKLKIGVIGLGGIANFYLTGIAASEAAEVWAICDSSAESLAARGEQLQIPEERRFLHHKDLLACADIDAVTIGTPNASHFTIARDAIMHNKPFALEKPVSLHAEEAAILQRMLKARPIPHLVCFSYRYKPAVRYAKWLIEQGKLGSIRHIYSQYLQSWANRSEVPLSWRFQKSLSGSGALGDLGSHILDLHRFLVGETERLTAHCGTIIPHRSLMDGSAQGAVDVDDYCHVLAGMEQGISSTMSITRFAHGRGNYQRIEIYGSEGALVYSLDEEDTLQLDLAENGRTGFQPVNLPPRFQASQMEAFFRLVQGRGDGLDATIEDGYINQLTLDAILESCEREIWVRINKEAEQA